MIQENQDLEPSRQIKIMTGRGGMEMFQRAMQELSTSTTCTTTKVPEKKIEENLETPDFSRIFALQTNY